MDRVLGFIGQSAALDKARKIDVALKQAGLANADHLRALDNTLRSMGLSLALFKAERGCGDLGPTEKRYFVHVAALPAHLRAAAGGRVKRACVEDTVSGARRLEVAWDSPRLILHNALDMGAVGRPSKFPLFTTWNVRGTMTFDVHHRRWDNVLNAIDAAGLKLVRLECAIVFSFGVGPWRSDGNFRAVEGAMSEWHKSSSCEDPFFLSLHD